MADEKITQLTADTSPTSTDLTITVDDPSGTPANKKVTLANLITKAHGLSDSTIVGVASGVLTSGTDVAIVDGGTGSSTASAAVDALGGAASTGTGGLVRKTNAALVTPDLGIPSAGTVTNLTGTASININGTVGGTTPTTAVFTTATINTSVLPDADDGAILGASGNGFSDIFLAEGAVINWDAGDATITQTGNVVAVSGADLRVATAGVGTDSDSVPTLSSTSTLTNKTLTAPVLNTGTVGTSLVPTSNDGAPLGDTTHQFSDLFLAEGGVINWDNGDATLTQVSNVVTLAGADLVTDNTTVNTALLPDANDGAALGNATTAFSDLFLAEGAVINFDNGDATITQTSNDITVAGISTFGVGTGTAVTLGTIELGDLSDTTISRVSSGVVAIEGVNIETTATLANNKIANIAFIIDGGGSAITTGVKGDLEIPFACTINRVTTLADQSGSIVVDIWKDAYANYPPTVADTITASAKPTLSTAIKAQDATLTGWTTSIAAGDTLRYNVDSITTCTRVLISLKVTKT